jgi:hypothetical protein
MSVPLPSASPLSCRLPEGFSEPEAFVDDIDLFGVRVRRAGLATSGPGGLELTGSAAALDEDPVARAGFELLERVATALAVAARTPASHGAFPESDAPERYRHARSNGIALHASLETARTRARYELAERDRILRAWYGETTPARVSGEHEHLTVPMRAVALALASGGAYDVEIHAFPDDGRCLASRDLAVAGAFLFPRRAGLPLAMGFGARPLLGDAAEAALREALQSVAFLWGEPLAEAPVPGPTALQQLEFWQGASRAEALRGWLAGDHVRHAGSLARLGLGGRAEGPDAPVHFHDLTPSWSPGLHVVRATCDAALPLVFGVAPWADGLATELRVQPIG